MLNKIEIIRGTTNTFDLSVFDASGNVYTMEEYEKIIFGVKRKTSDTDLVIMKLAKMTNPGIYEITLSPEDTSALECGKYVYDVSLESRSNFYNVIEPNPFIIAPNVTEKGDGDK